MSQTGINLDEYGYNDKGLCFLECPGFNQDRVNHISKPSVGKFHRAAAEYDLSTVSSVKVDGAGKDAPVETNEQGGSQSLIPYRLDLLDSLSILEVAKVLKEGADKYGADNWRKIPTRDHINHLLMHTFAYLAGDRSDDHLSHIMCRSMFALGVELGTTKLQGSSSSI